MPLAVKINVALREQNCQKIGSERVKITFTIILENDNLTVILNNMHGHHRWEFGSILTAVGLLILFCI